MRNKLLELTKSTPGVRLFNTLTVLFLITGLISIFLIDPLRSNLALITLLVNATLIIIGIVNVIARPTLFRSFFPVIVLLIIVLIGGFFVHNLQLVYVFRMTIFLSLVILLARIELSSKFNKTLRLVSAIIICYLFVQSFGYKEFFAETNSATNPAINPNTMSLAVLVMYVLFDRFRSLHKTQLLSFTVLVISIWAILNFEARTALLCLIVYLLLSYTALSRLRSFGKKTIYIIVCLIAFLFPLIYIAAYDNFSEVSILNKSLYSGRQDVWQDAQQEIMMSGIVTGSASQQLIADSPSGGLHNVYVDMVYRIGLPLSMLFLFLLYIAAIRSRIYDAKAYAAVICILFYGFTEAVLFGGTYIGMLIPFMLVNTSQVNKKLRDV